jgi:hypothetical protein
VLGIILFVLGYVLVFPILETLGIILLLVGVVLYILGAVGRPVAGRRDGYHADRGGLMGAGFGRRMPGRGSWRKIETPIWASRFRNQPAARWRRVCDSLGTGIRNSSGRSLNPSQ